MKSKDTIYILMLFLLFVTGVAVRRVVFEAQQRAYAFELPFTLESALQYRLVRKIHEGGGIPYRDDYVEAPDGIRPSEIYTIGAEYLYAWGARLLPAGWTLTTRVRWVALIWFCLGIPLMGLWVHGLTRSRMGGLVAAAFYAVTVSSVIRSTGQELSRENYALPILLAHLAATAWSGRWQGRPSARVAALLRAGAAFLLAWAVLAWDMIQFYLYLWLLFSAVAAVRGQPGWFGRFWPGWLAVVCGYALNPYARAHGALLSPFVIVGAAMLLSAWIPASTAAFKYRLFVLLGGLGAALLIGNLYNQSYGHFADLLLAKIRFLNVKPADPSLLNFNQRIMWTPALNSATWALTTRFLPVILPLSFLALSGCVRKWKVRDCPGLPFVASALVVSLIAYVLFVRFHVFVALFGSALPGCWLGGAAVRKSSRTPWVAIVLLTGWVVDACHTVKGAPDWGRTGVYYEELNELTDYLAGQVSPATVLGNFGVSSSVLAYGNCPIILHPKFETPMIREKVRQYGEQLFKADEQSFRDWADEQGAVFYVHALGEFSSVMPERQMRYFVNALEPRPDAAARLLEFSPEHLRYFHQVWSNPKYRVFRVLSRAEEARAARLSELAYEALSSGEWEEAEAFASDALRLDVGNVLARRTLGHLESLRAQGVVGDEFE